MPGQYFFIAGLYSFLSNRSIPEHIPVCSIKPNWPALIDKSRTAGCPSFANTSREHFELVSGDNLRASIPQEVFLKVVLQEHKNLLDIILKRKS